MLNFSFSKVLSFLSFSSFPSLTVFHHSHDFKLNTVLFLIQTEVIAETLVAETLVYPRIKVFLLKTALILYTLKNNTCFALSKTGKQ